jgi:hypothetical protein
MMAALLVFTATFRFLALDDGFPNDHFLHLVGAQQMLFGEWPTRDFQDPGLPLMYATSAAAQLLLGRGLFAEAVLVSLVFAAAAALTAAAVLELTRSPVLAWLGALFEVAIFPRTYGYPKVLLYAAGFLLIQRYVTHPTAPRRIALAVCVVIAFLFRHDHGVFLGIGCAVATLLAPGPDGWRGAVRRTGNFLLIAVVLVSPYLLYVQAHSGLWAYVRTGLEFTAREAQRQWHIWPALFGAERPLEAALVYEVHILPVAAVLALLAIRRDAAGRMRTARILPIAIVALLVNYSFVRDPLNTRLPDAIVPAIMLGAWLTSRAFHGARRIWITAPAAVSLVALFGASVLAVGGTVEQLDRGGMLSSWRRLPERVSELTAALHARAAPSQIPSRAAGNLTPFLEYVQRCTTSDQRLLVAGFLPEVPFFAQRAFAGGQSTFVPGYYRSDQNQKLVLARLRDELVPFALVPADYGTEIDTAFPLVAGYLRARYAPLVTLGSDDETAVQVLFDGTLAVTARDAETGWPCVVGLTRR